MQSVTRIVAGTLGGRRISAPLGAATRPTSDRVREALFSAIEAVTDLAEARFADLYAGSGAVGLEALSRGAAPMSQTVKLLSSTSAEREVSIEIVSSSFFRVLKMPLMAGPRRLPILFVP